MKALYPENDEEGTLAGGKIHKKLLFSYSSTF